MCLSALWALSNSSQTRLMCILLLAGCPLGNFTPGFSFSPRVFILRVDQWLPKYPAPLATSALFLARLHLGSVLVDATLPGPRRGVSWVLLLHLAAPGNRGWQQQGLVSLHITLLTRGESKQDSARHCREQLLQCCLADGAHEGDHLFLSKAPNFSLGDPGLKTPK